MSHMYLTQPTAPFGRPYLDLVTIAKDLAPLVGGTAGEGEPGEYGRGVIQMDGYLLTIRTGPKADSIAVAAFVPACGEVHYSRRPTLPSANVSLSKGIERVASDIKRRVISEAVEPMAECRKVIASAREARAELEATVADWSARFPHLQITLPDDKSDHAAKVYAGPSAGTYFSGRLSADGGLYVDRIGSLDSTQAQALLALLVKEA